jgi:uncharacterized protein YkwD
MKRILLVGLLLALSVVALVLKVILSEVNQLQFIEKPVSVQPSPSPIPTPTATPKPIVLDGGRLFNLVNAYRAKNGLKQMIWFHPLCEYSKERSSEIKTDFEHDQFLADSQSGLLWKYCPDCSLAGENLAEGYYSEEAILQAWINSPTHKDNLDGDWDIACSYFYKNNYVSLVFGRYK